jgi:hypothetical protein
MAPVGSRRLDVTTWSARTITRGADTSERWSWPNGFHEPKIVEGAEADGRPVPLSGSMV